MSFGTISPTHYLSACMQYFVSACGHGFRPTITPGSALSEVSFQDGFVSDLSAISMPIDLDRSNRMIVKRIINKWSLNENKGSDASCYREIEIW
jgi:hypothetical protein